MADRPVPSPTNIPSRAEKLSILSALLGPDALAKIREGQPAPEGNEPVEIDAGRVAWHRNKLLERLRHQVGSQRDSQDTVSDAPLQLNAADFEQAFGSAMPLGSDVKSLDAKLVAISDPDTLAQEHPAVIARLMTKLPREDRINAMKSLPGPIARSIVRRLK